ncbi:MAG: DUF1853 family protein, partial [Betaproteobacteria bacterium]
HLGSVGVVLPRISWLAPARLRLDLGVEVSDLKKQLHQHFEQDNMPLMVASLRREGDEWFETERGFVVPDAWPQQAVAKING